MVPRTAFCPQLVGALTAQALLTPPSLAVPCLKRAADVEEYGEREEFEVEAGGESGEGWTVASNKPAAAVTVTNEEGFEEIPNIEGAQQGYG